MKGRGIIILLIVTLIQCITVKAYRLSTRSRVSPSILIGPYLESQSWAIDRHYALLSSVSDGEVITAPVAGKSKPTATTTLKKSITIRSKSIEENKQPEIRDDTWISSDISSETIIKNQEIIKPVAVVAKPVVTPAKVTVAAPKTTPPAQGFDNIFSGITKAFNDLFNGNTVTPTKKSVVNSKDAAAEELKRQLMEVDANITDCKTILNAASLRQEKDTDKVVDALIFLEKLMRQRNKLDDGITSQETIKALKGTWRLIFTTGTVDVQKKTGKRVNYFPIKAMQSFNPDTSEINNGIYLGDFPVLKFYGSFEWKEKARKLEFDFDKIEVLKVLFNLPKGGAAKIGQSTGLGSESNVELLKNQRKPFFNWISADETIATARGGGGGLALWRRVDDA